MEHSREKFIVFECDRCGAALDTGTKVRKEAVAELKARKWRFHNGLPGGRFKHYCKDCKRL